MKIALVSPFPDRPEAYPQVTAVVEWLRRKASVQWITISERGFQLDRLIESTLLAADWRASVRAAVKLIADFHTLRRASRECDLILAIDFMALVLAQNSSSKPIIFWSHDYISMDEERYGRKINRMWLFAVRRALRKTKWLMIQDQDRARSFGRSLGIDPGSFYTFYLPVCMPPLRREPLEGPNVWPGVPYVMQIGNFNRWRSCTDFLLEQFKASKGSFELSLHGCIDDDIALIIETLNRKPKISEAWVPHDRIPEVVAGCSVGFLGNKLSHEQFFLLKNASGQLVEFLRCGKPVISMGDNNLGEFVEREGVGLQVRNAIEFRLALEAIHRDYGRFSRSSLQLFKKRFNLYNYTEALSQYLEKAMAL
jgi:glycosyltransferase involved in cell wall biosynthesis